MLADPVPDGGFILRIDAAARVVLFEPLGHWTLATVARWDAAFTALATDPMRPALRLPIDLRRRRPHAQDVADRIQGRIAALAPAFERVAVVLPPSALTALQSRRIAGRADGDGRQSTFSADEREAARRWLG